MRIESQKLKNHMGYELGEQKFHLENCLLVSNLFIIHDESPSAVRDIRRHLI